MYEPAVARKPTTSATSSGRPIRPRGIPARIPAWTSSGRRAVISVAMNPGATELTRMFAPPKLPGERLRQGVHGRLLHRVGNLAGVPRMADDARYVDDPAAVRAEHEEAKNALGQVPGAAHDRALRVELLDPHPLHVGVDGDPGVVHEDVEAVRLRLQPFHQRIHLIDFGQVRRKEESVADLRQQARRGIAAGPVMDPHPESLCRQLPHAGRPDPRCAARHHRHLFFTHFHSLSPIGIPIPAIAMECWIPDRRIKDLERR